MLVSYSLLQFCITLELFTVKLSDLHFSQVKMWSFTAVLFEFNWRLKCSFVLMPKCRVVLPMYNIVASRKHVN